MSEYVDICVCFRQITTLSTQSVTAQAPDGELPFLTDRGAARACQSQSEAQTAVRKEPNIDTLNENALHYFKYKTKWHLI